MLFFLYVTYQELYLRLLPASVNQTVISQIVLSTAPLGDSTEKDETTPRNSLWEKLTRQMDEKELWRNPDLMLEDLAKNLYTNRTTLSALIQQQGYSGYSEFINRRRVEAFVEAVNIGKPIKCPTALL